MHFFYLMSQTKEEKESLSFAIAIVKYLGCIKKYGEKGHSYYSSDINRCQICYVLKNDPDFREAVHNYCRQIEELFDYHYDHEKMLTELKNMTNLFE